MRFHKECQRPNPQFSEEDIKLNLALVKLGAPLTMSLSELRRNCNFKRKWEYMNPTQSEKDCIKRYQQTEGYKQKVREYNKKYYQRPGVKEHIRDYQKRYRKTDKSIAYQKAYNQRDYVKAKVKEKYRLSQLKKKNSL